MSQKKKITAQSSIYMTFTNSATLWHQLTRIFQSRPKCKIFGQARRPAPTKACRGDSLWSPVSTGSGKSTDLAQPKRNSKKGVNLE
jgi:hypothetical protein